MADILFIFSSFPGIYKLNIFLFIFFVKLVEDMEVVINFKLSQIGLERLSQVELNAGQRINSIKSWETTYWQAP